MPIDTVYDNAGHVIIEAVQNEDTGFWEVHFQGHILQECTSEAEAGSYAKDLFTVYETGYVNGLLLGYESKERAKQALENRHIRIRPSNRYDVLDEIGRGITYDDDWEPGGGAV